MASQTPSADAADAMQSRIPGIVVGKAEEVGGKASLVVLASTMGTMLGRPCPPHDDQGGTHAQPAHPDGGGSSGPQHPRRLQHGSPADATQQARRSRPHGRLGPGAPCILTDRSSDVPHNPGSDEGEAGVNRNDPPMISPTLAAHARDALHPAPARGRGQRRRCGPQAGVARRGGHLARAEAERGGPEGHDRDADGGDDPGGGSAAGDGRRMIELSGQRDARLATRWTALADGDPAVRTCRLSLHTRREGSGSSERDREAGPVGFASTDTGGGGPNRDGFIVARNCPGSDVSLEGRVLCVNSSGAVGGRRTDIAASGDAEHADGHDPRLGGLVGGWTNGDEGGHGAPGSAAAHGVDRGGTESIVKRRRLRGKQPARVGGDVNSVHEFSGGPSCSLTSTLQRCLAMERDGPLLTAGSVVVGSGGEAAAGSRRLHEGADGCWSPRSGRPPEAER